MAILWYFLDNAQKGGSLRPKKLYLSDLLFKGNQ